MARTKKMTNYYGIGENFTVKAGDAAALEAAKDAVKASPNIYAFESKEDAEAVANELAKKTPGNVFPIFEIEFGGGNAGRYTVHEDDEFLKDVADELIKEDLKRIDPKKAIVLNVKGAFFAAPVAEQKKEEPAKEEPKKEEPKKEEPAKEEPKKEEPKKEEPKKEEPKVPAPAAKNGARNWFYKGSIFFAVGGAAGAALWKSEILSGLLSWALEATGLPALSTLGMAAQLSLYVAAGMVCFGAALGVGYGLMYAWNKGKKYYKENELHKEVTKLTEAEANGFGKEFEKTIKDLPYELKKQDGSDFTSSKVLAWGLEQVRKINKEDKADVRVAQEKAALEEAKSFKARTA